MKQTTKRVVAFFAAMGLMVSGLSLNEPVSADAKAKAKVKSVTIKNVKKKLSLKKGASFKLKVSVKVKPNKAKYKKVTYKSSKKKIVKVSSKGKLTACQAGTAKITVRSKTNKKKKAVITVVVKDVQTEKKGQDAAPTVKPTVSPTKQPENDGRQTVSPTAQATATPTMEPTAEPTPVPDGTSTLMRKPFAAQGSVGQKLSELSVSSGKIVDSNGTEIKGTYEWEQPDTTLEKMGKTHATVKFVPKDSTFAEISGISIPIHTMKNIVKIEKKPTCSSAATGKKLSQVALSGGRAVDAEGKVVSGSFGWADDTVALTNPGKAGYMAVFTPTDNKTYREVSIYVNVNVTGTAITSGTETTNVKDGSSLKRAYGDIFGKVGNALVGNQMYDSNCVNFTASQYNSVTMGNEMKPDSLLKNWNPSFSNTNPTGYVDTAKFTYAYKDTKYPVIDMNSIDNYLNIAYKNGMKMRFHVFVWHKQTPQWFFKENFNKNGAYVSKEVMDGRLEYLVRNVMTHIYSYKNSDGVYVGREVIDNWDMANEYTHNNDGGEKSYWDEVYYPDYEYNEKKHSGIHTPVYIKEAFAIGHSILEDFGLTNEVSLMYNDYNTYQVADKIVTMVQYFNTKDEVNPTGEIICDGVGMQTHLDMGYPDIASIGTSAIDKFKAAGFEIQLTEMDLTDKVQSETSQANQIAKWYNLMMLLMTEKDSGAKITGIIWWGPSDDYSWRSDGVPLLYSKYWQAKEHYFQVIEAVSSYNQGDSEWQIYV